LLQGNGELGGGRVEQPRAGGDIVTVETCYHKNGEPALKVGIIYEPTHRTEVDIAGTNFETRVTVPLTNVIEPLIVMFRAVEEAHSIASGLHKIHNKPRKGSASLLKRQFTGKKVRWGELLAEYLPPDFLRAGASQRGAQKVQLVIWER
jgi:hypothetical protein